MSYRRIKNPHRVLAAILFLSALLSGCGDNWVAVVYPDRENLKFSARIGPYKTLDDCRVNARARLYEFSKQTNPGIIGTYECGKNCDDGSKLKGVALCEETVR